MKVENLVNNCNVYLSGFQDVKEHRTGLKTLSGVLKIVTYCLLIPPVIATCLKKYYGNIASIRAALENPTALKTERVKNKAYQIFEKKQNELIEYLVYKAKNVKNSETDEIDLFKKGFRLLNFESQKQFFLEVGATQRTMENALSMIPTDITFLNFADSPKQTYEYSRWELPNALLKAKANSELFVNKLKDFEKLERVDFHSISLDKYDSKVNGSVEKMLKNTKAEEFNSYVENQSDSYTKPLLKTLVQLREVITRNPNLERLHVFCAGSFDFTFNPKSGDLTANVKGFDTFAEFLISARPRG